jgi:hypothetical protein
VTQLIPEPVDISVDISHAEQLEQELHGDESAGRSAAGARPPG